MKLRKLLRPGWLLLNLCLVFLSVLVVFVILVVLEARSIGDPDPFGGGNSDFFSRVHENRNFEMICGYSKPILPKPITEPVQVRVLLKRNLELNTSSTTKGELDIGFFSKRAVRRWIHRGGGVQSCLVLLGSLPALTSLEVYGDETDKIPGDEFIRMLSEKAPNLTTLEIGDSEVTDEGLAMISKIWPDLRTLWLGSSRLTDKSAESFERFHGLEGLVLNNCDIGRGTGSVISQMSELRDLNLSKTLISIDEVVSGSKFHRLESLSLGKEETPVNFDYSELNNLVPKITRLYLENSGVTDESLKEILKLPNLDTVWLRGSQISDDSLDDMLATEIFFEGLKNSGLSKAGLKKVEEHNTKIAGSIAIG